MEVSETIVPVSKLLSRLDAASMDGRESKVTVLGLFEGDSF